MNRNPTHSPSIRPRRKSRLTAWAALAALSAGFLVWDLLGRTERIPGPVFLNGWLIALAAGGAALLRLAVEGARRAVRRIRPRGSVQPRGS